MPSRFPTRLWVRCPECHGEAEIDRSACDHAQPFCSRDGVPLIVFGVVCGAPIQTLTCTCEVEMRPCARTCATYSPAPAALTEPALVGVGAVSFS